MTHKESCQKYIKSHPWYQRYGQIKQRCNNPKAVGYKDYGGRGIKCFLTIKQMKFLWFRDKAYLMEFPTIDREDNNGNYELSNCRFIENVDNVVRNNIKSVLQYSLEGKFIKEWDSQLIAYKTLNINRTGINNNLKGRQATAYGFIWKYKNEK